ncbi:hypothetical protein BDV26DRAFT_289565 [Aspergillus bertholletiae]|uniref:Uncharacterized protein n=1 Tax=Aspergillus bertholletiae TaxID=1226010 RepID=A0A5N7BHW5_9EURO|nr:hypothetical protein BDV26DRAFT_289565 [Aspergillus bertholletiae]
MTDYTSEECITRFKEWIHAKGTSRGATILKPGSNVAFAAALHGMARHNKGAQDLSFIEQMGVDMFRCFADDETKMKAYGELCSQAKQLSRSFPSRPSLHLGSCSNAVVGSIVCWEADHSSNAWYDKLIKGMRHLANIASDLTFKISNDPMDMWISELVGQLPYYSDMATLLFWIENVSNLIAGLLEWLRNKDDLVCEHNYGWSREWLARAISNGSPVTLSFDGGKGGHHKITVGFTSS